MQFVSICGTFFVSTFGQRAAWAHRRRQQAAATCPCEASPAAGPARGEEEGKQRKALLPPRDRYSEQLLRLLRSERGD